MSITARERGDEGNCTVITKSSGSFWRTELIFYRRYLKTKKRPVNEIPELFEQMESLVQRNLIFVTLDTEKLYQDLPKARTLALNEMTPNGALKVLTEFTKLDAKRFTKYFLKCDGLPINYTATLPIMPESLRSASKKSVIEKIKEKTARSAKIEERFEKFFQEPQTSPSIIAQLLDFSYEDKKKKM